MSIDLSAKMGEISAVVLRLEQGQKEQVKLQAKMFTSLAVMENKLSGLHENRAANCGPRIESLEETTDECKELRAGPRIEAVEVRQDKMLWGGVGTVLLAIGGIIVKALWK